MIYRTLRDADVEQDLLEQWSPHEIIGETSFCGGAAFKET